MHGWILVRAVNFPSRPAAGQVCPGRSDVGPTGPQKVTGITWLLVHLVPAGYRTVRHSRIKVEGVGEQPLPAATTLAPPLISLSLRQTISPALLSEAPRRPRREPSAISPGGTGFRRPIMMSRVILFTDIPLTRPRSGTTPCTRGYCRFAHLLCPRRRLESKTHGIVLIVSALEGERLFF